jgi:hypothetical protein
MPLRAREIILGHTRNGMLRPGAIGRLAPIANSSDPLTKCTTNCRILAYEKLFHCSLPPSYASEYN